MSYLLTEIVCYLVGAGLVGFVVGWFVRGTMLSKVKHDEKVEMPTTDELTKNEEVIKDEIVDISDEKTNESAKPILLSQAPEAGGDKLSNIKGIGPILEKKLNELGIYTFEQIASWDEKEELWISMELAFPKRVTREEWVKQAKELLENK